VIQVLYSKALSKGDRGDSVSDLQRRLNHLHFKVVGTADGTFGKNTELAVVRLQNGYGLKQDGLVGPITSETALEPTDGQVSAHFNIFNDILFSRGNGNLILYGELIYRMEKMRSYLGNKPIVVTSCYRDFWYNFRVGGVIRSQHKLGKAADVFCPGVSLSAVAAAAKKVGFTYIQIYWRKGFVHCDIR
jgi:peptidoglycan hydrolase-like protein with peptidoglycan-binding domain